MHFPLSKFIYRYTPLFRRFTFLIIAVLCLMMGTLPIHAQDCEGLSIDDCNLWRASYDVTNAISSSAFTLDIDLVVEEPFLRESVTLSLFADGAYSLGEGRDSDDLLTLLQSLSSDVSIVIDASALIGFTDDLSLLEQDVFSLDLSLVDGIGAINLSKLLPPGELEADWYGVDLGAIWQLLANAGGLEDTLVTPPEDGFSPIGYDLGGLIPTTTTRTDDTLDGQDVAVLQTTYHYDEALDNSFNYFLLEGLLYAALEEFTLGQGYRERELQMMTEDYLNLLPSFSFEIERIIRLEDNVMVGMNFQFAYTPDVNALVDIELDALGIADLYTNIVIDIAFARSQIDVPVVIETPTDTIIVPFFELLPLLDDVQL